MTPGPSLTLDEALISSWYRGTEGRKKIPRKPRPVGVELKNLCDSKTMINLVLEKQEAKENMETKDFYQQLGATTSCVLRLTKPYWATGRTIAGDSWFGSVKSVKVREGCMV